MRNDPSLSRRVAGTSRPSLRRDFSAAGNKALNLRLFQPRGPGRTGSENREMARVRGPECDRRPSTGPPQPLRGPYAARNARTQARGAISGPKPRARNRITRPGPATGHKPEPREGVTKMLPNPAISLQRNPGPRAPGREARKTTLRNAPHARKGTRHSGQYGQGPAREAGPARGIKS